MSENRELRIEQLELPEIRQIYRLYLTHDFPLNERKPLRMIKAALKRGEYRCFGAKDSEGLKAYAFFVCIQNEGENLFLFDYLAVIKEYRGTGIGSHVLQLLSHTITQEAEHTLLEVDDPIFSKDSENRAVRERRLHFYLKNGLHDTCVRARVYGADYMILELPGKEWSSPDQAKESYETLYHAILPDKIYTKMVSVRLSE